ncbi:MAG TPA: FkbM family methyltransferase [Stellaceae bacterium]|nr:FkbM family methyltransferase [Stellaceae bacterium]
MAEEREYSIGRHRLILPPDHLLDEYQAHYRLYDRVLGDIAQIVWHKYPGASAIDIGANIGDSAALICRDQDFPVLCIEGSPRYLGYLRRNLERLPATIEIAPVLVGGNAAAVPKAGLQEKLGTARITSASATTDETIEMRPLADILAAHSKFSQPRLIKSDTDGSDFEILASSIDVLRAVRPVLFFEYDPKFRIDGFEMGLATLAKLHEIGYSCFLVYDNFGNCLEIVTGDPRERFAQLNRYLMSHALFGPQIHYFDVCACGPQDEDIARLLYAHQSRVLDAAIARRRNGQ